MEDHQAPAARGKTVQTAAVAALTLTLYLLFFWKKALLLPLTERPAESARRLAKACLLFSGLAAVQLLTFLEMLGESTRGVLLDQSSAFVYAIGPAELLKKIFVPLWYGFFPQSAGDPTMVNFYFGLAPLAAAAGFSALKDLKQKLLLAGLVAAELLVNAQFRQKLWVEPEFFSDMPAVLKGCPPDAGLFHSPLLKARMDQGFQLGNAGDALLLRESAYPSYGSAFGFKELGSYQVLSSKRARFYAARIEAAGPGSPLLAKAGIGAVITLKQDAAGKLLPEPSAMADPAVKNCFLEPRTGTAEILEEHPGFIKARAELAGLLISVMTAALLCLKKIRAIISR